MKLAYIHGFGNKGNTFVAKVISTDSLSQQTKANTIHQYLTPDYFLPASCSESYYSKKYSGNHTTNTINHHHAANTNAVMKTIYQSKSSKISRVVSVMLLSLSFLATAVEVKAQPNTASDTISLDTIVPNPSFLFGNGSAGMSSNIPTPPVPPAAPAMPDLVGDASSRAKADNRSAFLESIRNFGKKALKKVKREPKPKVVSSDGDLMSQLYDTLERRRMLSQRK